MLGHADCVKLHFFNLSPHSKRKKNNLKMAFCFCWWRESNLGRLSSKWVHYSSASRHTFTMRLLFDDLSGFAEVGRKPEVMKHKKSCTLYGLVPRQMAEKKFNWNLTLFLCSMNSLTANNFRLQTFSTPKSDKHLERGGIELSHLAP